MTNKERTVLFVLGATMLNLILTLAITVAVFLSYVVTIARIAPPRSVALPLGISFIAGILLSNLIYKRLLVVLGRKYNLEEKFGVHTSRQKRQP